MWTAELVIVPLTAFCHVAY